MTDHYHVFVRLKVDEKFRLLAKDLSERELKKSVVTPYKAGKDIYQMSTITSPEDIGSLLIVRTSLTSEAELKRISEEHQAKIAAENARSFIKIISVGRGHDPLELRDAGEDVTANYISDGPGSGTIATRLVALLHNQWVTGVGLLIIGLIVGKYWGGA